MRVTSTKRKKSILLKTIILTVVFLTILSPIVAQTNNESLQPYPIEPPKIDFDEAERERDFWRMIEKSKNVDEFFHYLKEFPNGVFTSSAQSKIQKLQRAALIEPETSTQQKPRVKLEDSKEARENLYNNLFLPNYKRSATDEQRKIAHNAALDYLYNFGKDNDDIVKYLQKWVNIHNHFDSENSQYQNYRKFNYSVDTGNVAEIFATGNKILNEEPDNLTVILHIVEFGYLNAHIKRIDVFNKDSLSYAKQAIDKIQAGKMPIENNWNPFESKEHALSWMNYNIGYIYQYRMNDKQSAAPYFYQSVQYKYTLSDDSHSRRSRSNIPANFHPHTSLGAWYLDRYNQAVAAFNRQKANPNIEEARKIELANSWGKYADLALNVYAHAYAKAKSSVVKSEVKNTLIQLYKVRYGGNLSGFEDFITTESDKPLANFAETSQ